MSSLRGRHGLTMAEKFWPKVDRRGPDECWPWTAGKDRKGYGVIRDSDRGKHTPAPRLAWELANGRAIPDGLFACHSCDNPACCNPSHIWIGNHTENMWDASRKGRLTLTHCKYGHEFTPENSYTHPNLGLARQCRACRQRRVKEYWQRFYARRAQRQAAAA